MARRKGAGLARYFKPLQRRHSPKDACYKWGILERERYSTLYSFPGGVATPCNSPAITRHCALPGNE